MKDVWNALSDPIRRKILQLLKTDNMNAGDIASHFTISKPSISHHLDVLKQAKLVFSEKKGQQIVYSINTTVFQDVLGFIAEFCEGDKHEKN
jgi:DNA-binding transcriptional ArsR family regulator